MHARYLACATLNIEECEKGPPMAGLFVFEPGFVAARILVRRDEFRSSECPGDCLRRPS
jgi:hypothetical protein